MVDLVSNNFYAFVFVVFLQHFHGTIFSLMTLTDEHKNSRVNKQWIQCDMFLVEYRRQIDVTPQLYTSTYM